MEEKLNQLFENYRNNQCADEEIIGLLEYFNIEEQEPRLRELIMQELKRSGEPNIRVERIEERLDLAYANVRQYISQDTVPVVRKMKLWSRIAAVAAAVAVVVSGVYFFNYSDYKLDTGLTGGYVHGIKPGKVGATLILASGKKIRLGDAVNGELANEAGVSINKSADGQLVYEMKSRGAGPNKINTLSTAKGETYKVRLPDGSLVWLNAASSLTYSASLKERGVRKVKLEGEAYFEIAKDKAHPFVVESKGQKVEVLGTHFNVNSYSDEPTVNTTLLEGAVKINDKVFLKPGEQAVGSGNSMTVKQVDAEAVVSWKNGDFMFNKEDDLKAAMRKIARWYNVKIIYDDSAPLDMEPRGWISRKNELAAVLNRFESTGKIHFKIEGRNIIVMK